MIGGIVFYSNNADPDGNN